MILLELNKPSDLKKKAIYKKIENLAKLGNKSRDIGIICKFITDDSGMNYLCDEFRKIKNRVYFNLDFKQVTK